MINLHNGENETERKIEKNEGIKDEEREREEVKDKENKKKFKRKIETEGIEKKIDGSS